MVSTKEARYIVYQIKMSKIRKRKPSPKSSSDSLENEAPNVGSLIKVHSVSVHTLVQNSQLTSLKPQNYRGLYTLALLFLGVNVLRLMLDNYLSFGILVHPPNIILHQKDISWAILSTMMQIIPLISTFIVEKWLIKKHYYLSNFIHFIVLAPVFTATCWISYSMIWQPLASFVPLLFSCISLLKIISLVAVNHENLNDKELTLKHYIYFLLAPTLCFQYKYPKSAARSWSFLFKRLAEVAFAVIGAYILVFQYQGIDF